MAQIEFSPSILTRPVYAPLVSQGAAPALMIADAAGAAALVDLAEQDRSVMDKAHVICIAPPDEDVAALTKAEPKQLYTSPSFDAALERIHKALADATMGTQLYLAGSEGLIGCVVAEALASGFPSGAIQSEHRGSIARRMQCVHCKGITEDVTTDPFTCSHCGLTLFVRDHFSRRLGAFQGVCVDAETPGVVPQTEEIRP
jgi:predicted RNA-binding Zn-ribbon protein involved in translation (DUF1610 family)